MLTPKRVYIYAVAAISLNSALWAIISLLRNILITRGDPNTMAIAFQIAVIVIGLPMFLVHWSWAQRLADKDEDERGSVVRQLYLYGNQTLFLIPIITSVFYTLETLLSIPSGRERYTSFAILPPGMAILYYLIAIVILAVVFYYLDRVIREDVKIVPEEGKAATVRRGYVYLFVAIGLGMTANSLIRLIQFLFYQIGAGTIIDAGADVVLTHEISRLIVGMPLWIYFWRWAQQLFFEGRPEERESTLRKFYEYSVIFISVFTVVTSTAFILSGVFKELMGVSSAGESSGDIRTPLSIMIVAGIIWAYHAFVLRADEKVQESTERQLGIRRLYDYLVAGIGLGAFIVGLSGDLSVLIRSLESGLFGSGLKEELAWFTAIWLIGLVVWILPWRNAQARAVQTGIVGAEERQSTVRRIYLYFFLFVATMTILSSVVYILFSILVMLLGEPGPKWSEVGQPVAFALIAAGVWLYHGYWLREDGSRSAEERAERLEAFTAVLIDDQSSSWMEEFSTRIQGRFPEFKFSVVALGSGTGTLDAESMTAIQQADLIVGPWQIAVPGGLDGAVTPEIAEAVAWSKGKKLIAPNWYEGWDWIGVERWSEEEIEKHTWRALRQIEQEENVRMAKPLGAGTIIGIIFGIVLLLIILSIPVALFAFRGFY